MRPRPSRDQQPPRTIRTFDRGLDVLFAFGGDRTELGVTDISRRLGLNKATVSRLLRTLARKGVVAENPQTRKYRLTFRLLEIVTNQLQLIDVRTKSLSYVRRLRDVTEETAGLYVASGFDRTCIALEESPLEVRRTTLLGRARPITSGTTGRVLLAYRPPEEVLGILAAQPPPALTPFSIIDSQAFLIALARVREQGYAVGVDQTTIGISGVAAPVFDHTGRVVAALSVSGPSHRWTMERMLAFAASICAAGLELSRELGYRGMTARAAHDEPAPAATSAGAGAREGA